MVGARLGPSGVSIPLALLLLVGSEVGDSSRFHIRNHILATRPGASCTDRCGQTPSLISPDISRRRTMDQGSSQYLKRLRSIVGHGAAAQFVLFGFRINRPSYSARLLSPISPELRTLHEVSGLGFCEKRLELSQTIADLLTTTLQPIAGVYFRAATHQHGKQGMAFAAYTVEP